MSVWGDFVQGQLAGGATATKETNRPCVGCYRHLDEEYRAIAAGPALVDRSCRSLLEITGADRVTWLQNLTTNEVKSLAPGEGCYTFFLNVQGRILFDANILAREGSIWVDLEHGFLDFARSHFEKYTITEDVSVADRSGEFVRFGLAGHAAKAVLVELEAAQAVTMPPLGTTKIMWGDCPMTLLRHDFCGPFAVEVFVPAARAVELWQALTDSTRPQPAVPAGDDAVQIHRIEAGLPWPFHEITDEYLPAETKQLERAVSFSKGCYLGQEVVGRMCSRDVVARELVGLEIDGDVVPPTGAELIADDDKTVGQLTSSCHSLAKDCVIGMGYVKTSSAGAGTFLRAFWENRSAEAVVVELPFTA